MLMKSAKLDRRITIERATAAAGSFNEPVLTWSTLATVWAGKEDVSDGERWRAGEVAAQITTRFMIRWGAAWADVNEKDRLMFGGRLYDITRVKEIGRREGIEITAAARPDLVPATQPTPEPDP